MFPDPVDQLGRLLDARRRQDDRKLLAAITRDKVLALDVIGDDRCEDLEDLVTNPMPEIIVHALEMVEIGHYEAQARSMFLCRIHFCGQSQIEGAPIVD